MANKHHLTERIMEEKENKEQRGRDGSIRDMQGRTGRQYFFCNPILFAVATSTFSKLCKNMYTVACRRVFTSTAL
jgi:hypothetical protein